MERGPVAAKGLKARIISGSAVMISGSTLGIGVNLAYNVAVAHFLGPKGFGNANALYTLLTLISAVTLSFQIVTSKIVAQRKDMGSRDAAFRTLEYAAWAAGILIAASMVLLRNQVAQYLDLPASRLVSVLAIGAAFYIPLGARRGYIQGAFGFRKLATNLVIEGVARLFGSIALIALGLDVMGVIIANSAAMALAYFAIAPKLDRGGINSLQLSVARRELSHATLFFAGQVLINNSDIVLVKHFFAPGEAGLYAAIAMVGRVTFSLSTAVVNSMFPVVAGTKREERKDPWLIGTALLLVLGLGVAISVTLRFLPQTVWTMLFGSAFHIDGPHGFPYLLSLYAITTITYCLSVVIMTYEMSYKIANTNWYQFLFSCALIIGLCRYHSSLQQVIEVQLVLLIGLLALVGIPFAFDLARSAEVTEAEVESVRLLHRLTEDDVIAEFLKSDFDHAAYDRYRDSLKRIVQDPDLGNKAENTLRRALLSLRHRALWSELPRDTEWFRAEITAEDLPRIRVFPRAQWTRFARESFAIKRVAERIRQRQPSDDPFVEKIYGLRELIADKTLDTGSVILIGRSGSEPLTILDGNHRFVASLLEGRLTSLKFVCGMSPSMAECCWYRTSLPNLARYARNLVRHQVRKRAAELVDLR